MLKRGVQSALTRGLEQWLWFLGVDTRNPEGNLLVRNGFRKFKPPLTKGSSRYQCKWRGNLIDLHSFFVGIYPERADGFIFIRARNQCFLYTDDQPPCPGDYPEDCIISAGTDELTHRFHTAASTFLSWLEEYEQWVDFTCGPNYRTDCYDATYPCHRRANYHHDLWPGGIRHDLYQHNEETKKEAYHSEGHHGKHPTNVSDIRHP